MYMGQQHGKEAKLTPNNCTSIPSSVQQLSNTSSSSSSSSSSSALPVSEDTKPKTNLVIIQYCSMNTNENANVSSVETHDSERRFNNNDVASNDLSICQSNDNQIGILQSPPPPPPIDNDVSSCIKTIEDITSLTSTSACPNCSNCFNSHGSSSLTNKFFKISKCSKTVPSHLNHTNQIAKATKAKKSNWNFPKLTSRSKREKKKGYEHVDITNDKTDSSSGGDKSKRISDLTTEAPQEMLSSSNSGTVPRYPPVSLKNSTSHAATMNAPGIFFQEPNRPMTTTTLFGSLSNGNSGANFILVSPVDFNRMINHESVEDLDEQARFRRAIELEQGVEVEAPPGYVPKAIPQSLQGTPVWHTVVTDPNTMTSFIQNFRMLSMTSGIHSQADYIHCLVPDLEKIISCCFYWGKMDRFEAEKLLDGKPEGTFLLRDSAQEDFLFSVSFRKYGRSLHARVEQFNHEFSFDSHDPGVYTAKTVTGLLEHYKDPSCVMFFEPMLTLPLHRNFVFPLQELARATIVSNTTYNNIEKMEIPRQTKNYLKDYHYKQRVHFRRVEDCYQQDST